MEIDDFVLCLVIFPIIPRIDDIATPLVLEVGVMRTGMNCLGVEWELPPETGIEASTDTVSLDLAVGGVQCRHETDPAARNPFARLADEEGSER